MRGECWHRFEMAPESTPNCLPAKVVKVCKYCGQRMTFTFKDGLPPYARRWVEDE